MTLKVQDFKVSLSKKNAILPRAAGYEKITRFCLLLSSCCYEKKNSRILGFERSPASSRRGLDDAAEVGFVVGAAGAAGDNLKRDKGRHGWFLVRSSTVCCMENHHTHDM